MVAVAKFPRNAAPAMDDREFSRWVDLLERRTGVVVPQDRKTFLVTGVRSRMRETGFAAYADYFQQLLSGPRGAIEWATLVDRLTVHQTHFFRHQPSLELVGREWLPDYVARERRVVLLEALAELLKPGGALVLGPGEVIGFSHPMLQRIGGPQTLAYRRNR